MLFQIHFLKVILVDKSGVGYVYIASIGTAATVYNRMLSSGDLF